MKLSIPFQLVELEPGSYHILVNATINGAVAKLIVDTGASRSVIDKLFDSGIRTDNVTDTVAVGFMSDNINIEVALITELKVEHVTFDNVSMAVANLSALRELYSGLTGNSIAGLLGCDFLVKNITSINFREKKLFVKQKTKHA